MTGASGDRTLVIVLGLTCGVTAAATVILAGYLWRPLPYPASDRIVAVSYPRANGPSPSELQDLDASRLEAIADLAVASEVDSFTILGGVAPFVVDGRRISADAFAMFGIVPAAGRVFSRGEAARGERVAMIGHHVWRERFGGSANAIGATVTVRATIRQSDAETFTIVGVLPPRFWHLEHRTSLLLPLPRPAMPTLLRLRDGVSTDEAASRISALVRGQLSRVGAEWTANVRSARDAHVDSIRPMLTAIGWGVALLTMATLANVMFLQIARGVARQREVAVRTVLGADRGALLRQMLAEGTRAGIMATIVAGTASIVLLRGLLPRLETYLGRVMPGTADVASTSLMLIATAVCTTGVAIALAVIMLAASRSRAPHRALAGHPSSTDSPGRAIGRQVIVASQVAAAFCLLVVAGLMIRTAWHLGNVDLGFDPRAVLSANVTLPESRYRTLEARRTFFMQLTERLAMQPEIATVGLTGWLPFRIGPTIAIEPDGVPESSVPAAMQGVNADYFAALGMRVLEGRPLQPSDRAGREQVVVVSRALVRALWNGRSPIGEKLRVRFSAERGRGFGPYTVVGVVDDALQSVMTPTSPQVYVSFYQQPLASNAFLQLKTRRPPLAVATTVARVLKDADPELALGSIDVLDALVAADGLQPRFLARALAAFALSAVAIAVIGIYAVSAWMAQQRQREAAVRVALGADRGLVATLLARRGAVAVAAGLALGWALAGPLSASIASELKGVAHTDLPTRLFVGVLLTSTSAVALLRPAWRTATANLAALLRAE